MESFVPSRIGTITCFSATEPRSTSTSAAGDTLAHSPMMKGTQSSQWRADIIELLRASRSLIAILLVTGVRRETLHRLENPLRAVVEMKPQAHDTREDGAVNK